MRAAHLRRCLLERLGEGCRLEPGVSVDALAVAQVGAPDLVLALAREAL